MNRTRSAVVVVLIALSGLLVGLTSPSSASPGKRVHGFHQFRSPSGNIGCGIMKKYVRCDIQVHAWKSPPAPKRCMQDYGGGLAVGAHGKGDFFCAGDTALNHENKLAYGSVIRDGRMSCTSKTTGMTCRNRQTGHGFFLSKQSYRRF